GSAARDETSKPPALKPVPWPFVTGDVARSVHAVELLAVLAVVMEKRWPPKLAPPSSALAIPAYSTSEPAFCAAAALLPGPPAARERITGFVLAHEAFCGPPRSLLIEFAEDHEAPLPADPRHTRHVPISTSEDRAGSSSQGASISESSLATCAGPTVGAPLKSVALHAPPLPHWRMLTPAAVEMYQSRGLLWSIATVPPSPVASCAHEVAEEPDAVDAVPFAPRPTSSVPGSVGCCAKLTTSA